MARVGLLIVLVCAVLLPNSTVALGSGAQPLVIRYVTRQSEATTGSDMVIRARVDGAQHVEVRYRLDQGAWETKPLVISEAGLYMGCICIPQAAGNLEYAVRAHGPGGMVSSPTQSMALIESVAPAWLPEGGQPGVFTDTTKKRYFYDAEAHGNIVNGYDLTNIYQLVGLPYSGSWPGVNSKCNQPRTEGTNPHVGLDLNVTAGGAVYAVMAGVVRDNYPMSDPVCYVLLIGHNPNGAGGDEFLTCYVHLDAASVPDRLKNNGALVSKGEYLGNVASGTGNNHLHLEYLNNTTDYYRLPQYLFWKNKTGVNARDADFICCTTDNGAGKVTVVAYGYDNTQIIHLGSTAVHLHYRVYPSTTWFEKVMAQNGDTYTYTVTDKGDVDYYVSARRYADTSIVAYRPAYWNVYGTGSPYSSPPPPEYFYMYIP